MVRINKYLSNHGIASRRKVEEFILEGRVTVNNEVIKNLGFQVGPNDKVYFDGNLIAEVDKVYFLMNKPRGIITSVSDEKGRKTVIDLLNDEDKTSRVYPIGRLDYDTKGVLLLTNDGELTNILSHPKNEIEREYLVRVGSVVIKDVVRKLRVRAYIDDSTYVKPKYVKIDELDKNNTSTLIRMILVDGKNHEVKKIFEHLGYKVIHLTRVRYAFLDTEGLKEGSYRPLKIHEIKKLYSYKKGI
ncbi:MAG: rRNA pseudouridine synthase [Acholeplasmatales bacterium]|jgi:23S rRNA pseudouridine2605 synthase|nr:rRNA pseudouridine synthase [Acholeplasmatales bacterium]